MFAKMVIEPQSLKMITTAIRRSQYDESQATSQQGLDLARIRFSLRNMNKIALDPPTPQWILIHRELEKQFVERANGLDISTVQNRVNTYKSAIDLVTEIANGRVHTVNADQKALLGKVSDWLNADKEEHLEANRVKWQQARDALDKVIASFSPVAGELDLSALKAPGRAELSR